MLFCYIFHVWYHGRIIPNGHVLVTSSPTSRTAVSIPTVATHSSRANHEVPVDIPIGVSVCINDILTVLGHLLRSIVEDSKLGAVETSATSELWNKLRYQRLLILFPGKAECGFTRWLSHVYSFQPGNPIGYFVYAFL